MSRSTAALTQRTLTTSHDAPRYAARSPSRVEDSRAQALERGALLVLRVRHVPVGVAVAVFHAAATASSDHRVADQSTVEQPGRVPGAHPNAPMTGVPAPEVGGIPRSSVEKLTRVGDPHCVLNSEVVLLAGTDHLVGHPGHIQLVHDQLDATARLPTRFPAADVDGACEFAVAIDPGHIGT